MLYLVMYFGFYCLPRFGIIFGFFDASPAGITIGVSALPSSSLPTSAPHAARCDSSVPTIEIWSREQMGGISLCPTLPAVSPQSFAHFTPFSVNSLRLVPGSRKQNGGKTAENGRKAAEK